jgi:DMSO/TMAO reductase YedYZ molybdopterin-dependent catalytic subunit
MKIKLRASSLPREEDFRSVLRSTQISARLGLALGATFFIAFVTGLISHFAQVPVAWLPTRPSWLYALTQGLHVAAGTASIPLILVKLWIVFPKLFARENIQRWGQLSLAVLQRLSVALLVGSSLFLLATGLANIGHWYAWDFSFRSTHYAMAWIAIGSLVVHAVVRWPKVRHALTTAELLTAGVSGISRRAVLRLAGVTAVGAAVTTTGVAVAWLRPFAVLSPRSGEGPQGIPINKSAVAAGVVDLAKGPDYRLVVERKGLSRSLTVADLADLPQRNVRLPIACVEGWSAVGDWQGIWLGDLLALVSAPPESEVIVHSLQPSGPFRESEVPAKVAADELTLLATGLNGSPLSLDHGFPCRLIAPNRPGVLQTKWVTRIEVLA